MQQKPLQLSVYICFDRMACSCCRKVSVYLLIFWMHLPDASTCGTLRYLNIWICNINVYDIKPCIFRDFPACYPWSPQSASWGLCNLQYTSIQQARVV